LSKREDWASFSNRKARISALGKKGERSETKISESVGGGAQIIARNVRSEEKRASEIYAFRSWLLYESSLYENNTSIKLMSIRCQHISAYPPNLDQCYLLDREW
jgi:hypothetical protein